MGIHGNMTKSEGNISFFLEKGYLFPAMRVNPKFPAMMLSMQAIKAQ